MYSREKAETIASSFHTDFQDFGVSLTSDFDSERFDTLLQGWKAVRRENHIPTRTELDLLRYPKIMPYMGLYEPVPGEEDWVFRLCGTAMVRIFEKDATGMKMFAEGFIGDCIKPAFIRYFNLVYNWPNPIWFNGTIWYWRDNHHISYKGMSLPLSKTGADITQNLQIFHYYCGEEVF